VEYYTLLVKHFGITGTATAPYLTITATETIDAATLLAKHSITADSFVLGINPGASYGSAKRWYPDRFAKVASRLSEKWNARVLIFGGSGETDIAAEIEQQMNGNAVNLSGKTTVRELMALINRCNFFITNDSGPMHIAAAFGVPLVAIFGSTDHKTTSPYTDKAVIVRKVTDCAPCKLRKCPTEHQCMTAITPDDVVQASINLLQSTGSTLREKENR
jgi:heptosyltransferase-2